MPPKKTPPKPTAKRKHRASRSNPTAPPADTQPAPPSANLHTEIGLGPVAALLDAKRLLLQAKRYRLRKQERLGDAFRRIGLDENAIAAGYAAALAKLQRGNADDSVEKSLLDVLKECARILEPPRPADRSASIDVNTVVQLVHKVDRPMRRLAERATPAALVEADDPLATIAEPPVDVTVEPPPAQPCSSGL